MRGKKPDETGKRLYALYRRYKNEKAGLDARLRENEDWWQGRQWQRAGANGEDGPVTPYLFNAVWNKHAGAMDNYPEPLFLEREERDRAEAQRLSKIVPLVLERTGFYGTYSDAWWRKLKNGFAVYFVFWDRTLENGLGDIGITTVDGLRFYAEPQISDIQQSRCVFVTSLMPKAEAKRRFPAVDFERTAEPVEGYFHEKPNEEDTVQILDCYERVRGADGRMRVHLTQLYGDVILYSTKTAPLLRDSGLYDHGMYPFVIDVMVPVEKSLYGMGLIDIGKSMQGSIDRMDHLIEKNSLVAARPRFLLKRSAGVDRGALLDMRNDVVEADSTVDDTAVRPIQAAALPSGVLQVRLQKADELKEILGNRDFQQGSVTGGVTAYSAIAALQESGNKLERDLISASYESFRQVMELTVELIRQFYSQQRVFRILGPDGSVSYLRYGNEGLRPHPLAGETGDGLFRKPVFDIKISAQKQNPFSTLQHNQLCIQLYQLGVFQPENAEAAAILLDSLILPGKESLLAAVRQNAAQPAPQNLAADGQTLPQDPAEERMLETLL